MEPLVTILLVDDSVFLRQSIGRVLSRAGYKVVSVGDGKEALQWLEKQRPDVVILDMLLPKVSGLEVLRILRASPQTSTIPVIALSSLPQCNEEKVLGDGAQAYFQKSKLKLNEDASQFLEEVERLVARAPKDAGSWAAGEKEEASAKRGVALSAEGASGLSSGASRKG